MNFKKIALLSASVVSFGVASLFADQITYSQLPNGTNIAVLSNATVTGSANFKQKQVGGWWGTGIAGGLVDGEIDKSEYIRFDFNEKQYVDDFTLTFLYIDGNYSDVGNEFAIVYEDGTSSTHKLQLTGATTATWDGSPVNVTNLSAALENNGGAFKVSNPFGNAAVKTVIFKADPTATSFRNADYAFHQITTHAVPEPASLSLLIVGIASLLSISVLRKKS